MNGDVPAFVVDVYLQPGKFYFGDSHTRIRTLLGSCVSITFWHPQRHIGGMCHYMLPSRNSTDKDQLNGKYADEAVAMFMQEIAAHKSKVKEYEVKIFGGGSMMKSLGRKAMAENIAERNVLAARRLVQEYGLTIKAESLGGMGYRQLAFELWSGDVWSHNVQGVLNMDARGVK